MKAHQFAGILLCTTLFSPAAFADKISEFPANPGDRPLVLSSIKEAVALVRVNDYAAAMIKMKGLESLPRKTPGELRDIENVEGVITVHSHFAVH
jgi:hypothetical protein